METQQPKEIESLLKEKRIFKPSQEVVKNSNIGKFMEEHEIKNYSELLEKARDYEWWWQENAGVIDWFEPWDKVVDESKKPFFKWFTGGKTNITYNALDRHIKTKKDKIAYVWEGEPGDVRKITYLELYREVNKFANALKGLGVKKGERVSIYMPMIPELPIAMLACAKIGAIHSVVFSGFSIKAVVDRANDAEAKVLVTVDGFYRRGKVVNLKANVDEALKETPTVEYVVVVKRAGNDIKMNLGRDLWYHELLDGQDEECEPETLDSEDLLYILYTSGTTGKPKGVVHVHGGYAIGAATTLKYVFDLKDNDVWWCAADIGWVTGHTYIVYAPLILGATSVMYEGSPDYPEPDRLWEMIDKHKVTVFYTAPTTIRMFMKFGEEFPKKHSLDTLRLLGTVGEPINPEAWMWYYKNIGHEKCQIMDTWWQTETGMFMITPMPITPLKPGSATKPFPGLQADVRNDNGESISGKGGHLVIKTPWPAMLRTIYKNPARYIETYWSKFEGVYLTGDVARKDEDGYFWIQGRSDDVLKVAGHRIGTAEVESALVSHEAVAESAIVGIPDPIKGEVIEAFVTLKSGQVQSKDMKEVLVKHVRSEIGPIATPSRIIFVPDLPKTRSGKIMRRVIKSLAKNEDPGDISTLANPEAVEAIGNALKE